MAINGSARESSILVRRLGVPRRTSTCGIVLLVSLIGCTGCGNLGTVLFGGSPDSQIKDSTKAIETARSDRERAKAYSSRGNAYSEKARLGRLNKQMSDEEYERLFALAVKDHNQAVAVNPNNAEVYFNRAEAYYERGSLDFVYSKEPWTVSPSTKSWLDAAARDFEKAAEKDPKNSRAFDMLGLTYESNHEWEKAIRAYTQVMAFDDHLGKLRLADVYCSMGVQYQGHKDFGAATMAYQKSVEFGRADDKTCLNEPFEALVTIYTTEDHQYDKAWETVHQAQKSGRWIAPEVIERLKNDSGRTN